MHKLHAHIVDMLWRASLLAVMLVAGLFAPEAWAQDGHDGLCGAAEIALPEMWLRVSLDVGYTEPAALSPALPCDPDELVPSGAEACSKLPTPPPVVQAEAQEAPRYVPASLKWEPTRLPQAPPSACWDTSSPDRCHAAPPMPTQLELHAAHAHAVASSFGFAHSQLELAELSRPRAPTARVTGRLLGPQRGFERALDAPPRA